MELESGASLVINGTEIIVVGVQDMSETEIREYLKRVKREYPIETISKLQITVGDDGMVALDADLKPPKFHRIRRITGYLVGSMDRWGNAKQAEEHDRVKHKI